MLGELAAQATEMKVRCRFIGIAGALVAGPALAQPAASDVAGQIRLQGYRCDAPVKAQRDPDLSRPDEAAWILTCANATYRVRLVPDMAASVEKLK